MTTKRRPSAKLTEIVSNIDEVAVRRTRDRMLLACKIADALKAKKISQRKFAQMLGKSESEVSELLSGNRNFGLDTLSDISACLKIDFLDISAISTVRVSRKDIKASVPKGRKTIVYEMTDIKTVPASISGWQSCLSANPLFLAL